MKTDNRSKIRKYLLTQIGQPTGRVRLYTFDANNSPYLKRSTALKIEEYMKNYQNQGSKPRWIIIPGLRGVGKTTLLAQLYTSLDINPNYKLYISLDEVKGILDISLYDILDVYEEILGKIFETLDKPVYLFLDEVQYEKGWADILRVIFNRSKKVFILCTGSSALSLQTNADVSRKSDMVKLYPLSFPEYLLIRNQRQMNEPLGDAIKEAIFNAENAEQAYTQLKALQTQVTQLWILDRLNLDRYIKYGTLPFALQITDEGRIYSRIEQTFNNIRIKDIPQLGKFENSTIEKVGSVLYALSSSDIAGLNKLGKTLGLAENTLRDLFNVFERSELLIKVSPYASNLGQVKKPSKYLFLSSAYRSMFFNVFGSIMSYDKYKGRLLEDIVGLYLNKLLDLSVGSSLSYDVTEGGADFIVKFLNERKIAIEVGFEKKGFNQLENTMKRIPCNYGISISPSELIMSESKNMLLVPLEYFLLIQ